MFENIGSFFKKIMKNDTKELVSDTTAANASKDAAKERLQLVLMQDRANVSADFLELMKQEIVDVIKKYIVVEEETIDVRIINQENDDGTQGAPSLCANIPILNIRNDNKGEKFRKEQGASITKEITNEEKEDVISNDDSNDNVEIVNANLENTELNNINIDENSENELEELEALEKKANEDIIKSVTGNVNLDNYDYDEEEDEDVTFDDLLKAAEEEEKMQKQEEGTVNKSTSKTANSKIKSTAKAKSTTKSSSKTSAKTSAKKSTKSTSKTSKGKKTNKK